MKGRKTIFLLFFATIVFLLARGERTEADTIGQDKSEESVHVVVKGDTLWALSKRYLSSPFLWPKLWQWNDHITNPHFIYPGDRIKLYPPVVKVKPPVAVPVEAPVETPAKTETVPVDEAPKREPEPFKEERYRIRELKSTGLVTAEDLKKAGKIVEAKDEKVMLSTNDIIYVGLTNEAKPGDIYTVFKPAHEVFHPVKKEKRFGVERDISIGFMIEVLGRIKIQSFSKNLATAEVIESFDAMERGDLVKPAEKIPDEVKTVEGKNSLEGYIIASKDEQQLFGENDVVYIDMGSKAGVQAGNIFIAYRQGKTFVDKVVKGTNPTTAADVPGEVSYELPATTIGRLLVIDVREDTATAVILKSTEEMKPGERIKSEVR